MTGRARGVPAEGVWKCVCVCVCVGVGVQSLMWVHVAFILSALPFSKVSRFSEAIDLALALKSDEQLEMIEEFARTHVGIAHEGKERERGRERERERESENRSARNTKKT